jgi:uncharacterized protein YjiS (DUF1127 family)
MARMRLPAGSPAARGSAGRWMADTARHAWSRYWTRRAEHAAVALLQGLDDRALKDIGLDRSEIESVVHSAKPGERRVSWTSARERGAPGCC